MKLFKFETEIIEWLSRNSVDLEILDIVHEEFDNCVNNAFDEYELMIRRNTDE